MASKIQIKLKSKVNLNQIPISTTSSTLPPSTSSTLPPSTSSTLSPSTSLTLPASTSSTLPPIPALSVSPTYEVDPYSQFQGHVYQNYTCTLNQTDLKTNKNKFYILQIIQINQGYVLMKRYGRIGEKGQIRLEKSSTVQSLCYEFEDVFNDKTNNNWNDRHQFVNYKGYYNLCEICTESTPQSQAIAVSVPSSQLHPIVQHFLSLVGNRELILKSFSRLSIDIKKLPLGKLSSSQITKAKLVLKKIQQRLQTTNHKSDLLDLSSEFYTLIPCVSATRMSKLESICNQTMVTNFLEMVDELDNLQVANQVLDTSNILINPLDTIYQEIKTQIQPVSDPKILQMIHNYVKNTHGQTHTDYSVKIVNVYEIKRVGEREKFDAYCQQHDIQHKQLLWHGTRLTNYLSILKQGLLLRADHIPGTVITGKMFSYGLYGSNSFSKSFNYTGYDNYNVTQCLFLAEFALGQIDYRFDADYEITEQSLKQSGYHSVQGQGKYSPSSSIVIDGVTIPQGQLTKSTQYQQCVLNYDEFIVYNEAQVNLKYIVEVEAIP